ncbi:SidE phosphodiesterase domain-containing protein [Legionella longbeachae]|uniref:SidE phosphodiesterase domain-containing protein n=1 Tax=Legionella longbeachae TaxID=450 RepID=UPI001E2CC704|nr:SidE phosphodiesterase domain-containing protein [Legionella longbeachae]
MFRAARTNELPGPSDIQTAARSAELFQIIALEFGFNPKLVSSIFHCISYTYTQPNPQDISSLHEGFSGEQGLARNKFNQVKRILHLSHHGDLVRVYPDLKQLNDSNKENLKSLIGSDKMDAAADAALNYARASCELTGAPYYLHNNTVERVLPPST